MSTVLIFKVEGTEHEIELDSTHAPNTLAKLTAALPATVDIHCAKIAGSHIMWPVPFLAGVEGGSDVLTMPPGAFFFWPERQYLEITYAALQAETASVNYLGKLKGDVAWLRDYADRQRREQGRKVFTAEVFIGNGNAPPTPQIAGEGALGRVREARQAAWVAPPQDVHALLSRRGLNIPFGPLVMAEGELRKLHELLWRLWVQRTRRNESESVQIAIFALEAAITRVGGFCHMRATASVLQDGIAGLESGGAPTMDVLTELILYVGRMAAWLDLHICWWPMNELTLEALGTQ